MRTSWKVGAASLAAAVAATLAAPKAAKAYKRWEESRRAEWIKASIAALESGAESLPPMPWGMETERPDRGIERDDPNMRRLVNLLLEGPRTPQFRLKLMKIAAAENRKDAALKKEHRSQIARGVRSRFVVGSAPVTPPTTLSWDNLGPASTRIEYNGSFYNANDTGRPTAIRVDPADANIVYLAVSGGGVWKTTNFQSGTPDWAPLTDNLGALAIGAMDLDPNDSNVVYIGTGDAFDQQGGAVVKSVDGGATW